MTTVASPLMVEAARQIVAGYTSAVLSGIVPDQAHLDNGGFHVSIDDLYRYGNDGDFSNRNPLDKSPPVTPAGRRLAAAVDISMSKADMIRAHGRVRRVWLDRAFDTRAKYINAVNCWDGSGDAVRYNFVRGTAEKSSIDHTWHNHDEWVRAFVDYFRDAGAAARAARAHVSMFLGQSHDAWLRQEKLGPYAPSAKPPVTPAPREDDDSMIVAHLHVPAAYAYDAAGKPLPGTDAGDALGTLPLPPAGHPSHRWGRDYKLYLSLGWDGFDTPARVRVAIHDGAKWHATIVDLPKTAGARKAVTVPAPAAQSAYSVSVGRVQPKIDTGAELPAPSGSITLLAEMLRN